MCQKCLAKMVEILREVGVDIEVVNLTPEPAPPIERDKDGRIILPRILVGMLGPDIAPDMLKRLIRFSQDPAMRDKPQPVQELGQRLHMTGGLPLMQLYHQAAFEGGLTSDQAASLEYAWDGIGDWQA